MNIKSRIEELEKRASDKDLLAVLATDRATQIRLTQHARNLRLAALRLTTQAAIPAT